MAEEILFVVMDWMNTTIRLNHAHEKTLVKKEMLQFLANLLAAHTTGIYMEKSIEAFRRFQVQSPSLARMRFIAEHLQVYSCSHQGSVGSSSWSSQRDQTTHRTEFGTVAFKSFEQIFLHTANQILTLDDDLFGTRAVYVPDKMLSQRKADREGHSAGVVDDALLRVVLYLRFRDRGEPEVESVKTLLSSLFQENGKKH